MFDPEQRSRAFNFALRAQSIFGTVMGISIMWSVYSLIFTDYTHIFIFNGIILLL